MANVAFKRGLETSLAKSLYNYAGADAVQVTEGTFYLTEGVNLITGYLAKPSVTSVTVTSKPTLPSMPY